MEYTPYTLPLIAASIIALCLAYFVSRHRQVPGRITFVLLMLALAVWSTGYALEISATAFAAKVFWAKVQYLGIAAIPLLWLRFIILYVGESRWLPPRRFALLAVVPSITLMMAWLNDRLHLIWADIVVDRSLGFSMLVFDYGPGLWMHAAYSYALLLAGVLLLFRAIVRLPRLGSRQGIVLLVAALAPWLGNALHLSGWNPFPLLDLTPFGFVFTGLAVAWGVGQFQFLSTVPVAHRAIIDSMQAGVIALDPTHHVVEMNPSAEKMFGVANAAAVGKAASRVFADQPRLVEWLTASGESTLRGELGAGDARREFEIRRMLLYDRRRHAGRLLTFYDITTLARAERDAEAAREVAEAANRAKSEFLANVSHEIRTPLNAIIGMTELTLEGELGDEQRDHLEVARSSADSLLSIINDILDFSKIEARKLELEAVVFDLHRLIEETIKMFAIAAADKGLELRARVGDGVPRLVVGDSLRLRQVLMNLISNAVKFTERGEVSLSAHAAADDVTPADPADHAGPADPADTADHADHADHAGRRKLAFVVADTGIGIGDADRRRIFESFAQADASTTRIYGGTGLGLTIASHLIGLMGGELEVESEVGVGSAFTFTIDIEEAAAGAAPAEPHQAARRLPRMAEVTIEGAAAELATDAPEARPGTGLPPLHVLVADDNLINQRLAAALLESRGHTVTVVGDGREAVEALTADDFDMVLMDVQMPHVDGVEATRSIRAGEQWSGTHVPIIAITAHAMAGDRERFLEAGMDGYVPKPLDAATLFETMKSLIDTAPES